MMYRFTDGHPNEIPGTNIYTGKDGISYNTKPQNWYHHGRSMPMGYSTPRLPGYVIVDANKPTSLPREIELHRPHTPSGPDYSHFPDHRPNNYPVLQPGPSDNFHGWPSEPHREGKGHQRYAMGIKMIEYIRVC